MLTFNRKLCVVLLVGIVLGMTAASAHVASHASGDLLTCELCCGHANPSHALPPAGLSLLPAPAEAGIRVEPLDWQLRAPRNSCHARGPPTVS